MLTLNVKSLTYDRNSVNEALVTSRDGGYAKFTVNGPASLEGALFYPSAFYNDRLGGLGRAECYNRVTSIKFKGPLSQADLDAFKSQLEQGRLSRLESVRFKNCEFESPEVKKGFEDFASSVIQAANPTQRRKLRK